MPVGSDASSASMNTATSFSSSWLGSSPSRPSPNRNGVRTPRGSLTREPFDSPSRQVHIEYNQLFLQSDRDFHKKLDQDSAERAKLHLEQLTKAAQEHKRVQDEARRELERIALEAEQEKHRKEQAQLRELERLKQEKARQEAEVHRQRLEDKRREEEAAKQAAENQRKLLEADARIRAQKEQEQNARKQKEEQERKAREAAAAAPPPPQIQPTQPSRPTQITPAPAVARAPVPAQSAPSGASAAIIEVHKRYLALHALMKKFRVQFFESHRAKEDPLKEHISSIRRNIRKRLGQVTYEMNDSKAAISAIREECFGLALQVNGPTIDIRPFLVSHQMPVHATEADAQYPQLLLYAWICFEKTLIQQWFNEAANEDGRIIQQLGLIAASLYCDTRYMWKETIPMTDTLLAKLHLTCPMLFGIRGDMGTNRAGLGMQKISINDADMNRYSQLMAGIGAGYGAISLRKFGGKAPAIPISEYWRAVSLICNTPTDALYPGHFMCLKGLLRDHVGKFLIYYGVHAKAVLRRATIDLPNRALAGRPGVSTAANLVKVLPDSWSMQKINIR